MSQPRICLLALIGLPAAGKSSFCHWLIKSTQTLFNFIHFCYDEFLEFHQLPQNLAAMDFLYKAQRKEIFQILQDIIKAIQTGTDVPLDINKKIKMSSNKTIKDYVILCDDNFYYSSMRYKIYQLCKSNSFAYGQVYFHCSEQIALERNASRNVIEKVPDYVIKQMAMKLEVPSEANKWESLTLTINTQDFKFSLEDITNFIFTLFDRILGVKAKELKVMNNVSEQKVSQLHKLDILLRKRIGDILSKEKCKDQSRSLQLNNKRKQILQQQRACEDLKESNFCEYLNMLN